MTQKQTDTFSLNVKIIPKSSKNEIIGWEKESGFLKIKIKEIPEKGKANKELIAFLAKILQTAKSNITIAKGQTSKTKLVIIKNISAKKAEDILIANLK